MKYEHTIFWFNILAKLCIQAKYSQLALDGSKSCRPWFDVRKLIPALGEVLFSGDL